MSYGYDAAVPVAYAAPSERALFVRRTYMHLAGAILAFTAMEFAIFGLLGVENVISIVLPYFSHPISYFVIFGLFIASGFIARMWAQSRTSMAMQYAGLGLYVLTWVVMFLPILTIAQVYSRYEGLIPTAGILTLALFGGLTTAAMITQKDFSFLGPILSIGSWLLLGVIVIAMIFPGFLQLGLWFSFLAVALAAGSILYTTSAILRHYSTDMHVAAALELFAAVAMLFFYILRILMQMRDR